jgi:hypothetical protein
MDDDNAELDRLRSLYKAAVDGWVAAIRAEEELVSVNHTVAEIDSWEGAHYAAEAAGNKVGAAKAAYEAALRARFFGIT